MTRPTTQEEAYLKGRKAFEKGMRSEVNPFAYNLKLWEAWLAGWEDAREDEYAS